MGREHSCAHVRAAHGRSAECDLVLVSAAKGGDHHAYAELCRRHSSQVFRTVLQIMRNTEDAEDALQESLMKAFVHLGGFQERSAFSSWLTRIAINCAFALLRSRRSDSEDRLTIFDRAGSELHREFVEPSPTPEDVCIEGELARTVRRAVSRLPPNLRAAVSARYAEEASVEETARMLGITEGATKARLHRGRAALRISLEFTRTRAFRQPGHSGKSAESGANDFAGHISSRTECAQGSRQGK